MASLILLANQTVVPAELLQQLAENDPIQTINAWPLAIGYWITLAFIITIIAFAGVYWWRTKRIRRYFQQLKRIQSKQPATHCRSVHLLLRKILQDHSTSLASCNDQQFLRYVMNTLATDTPPQWVNAHYQEQMTLSMPWTDIRKLIKHWSKEAPR